MKWRVMWRFSGAMGPSMRTRSTRAEATQPNARLIPVGGDDDWYARRVGVAAVREINKMPAGRPSAEEPIFRPAGMRRSA
jgi:hypothetical protein